MIRNHSKIASVLIGDDHPLLLRALVGLIASEPDFQIIAAVTDGAEALAGIRECQPDIAVLDLVMPRLTGMDVLKICAEAALPTRIVFLTAVISDEQIIDATIAGVNGILLKESAPEALINSLRQVADGGKWLPADLVEPAFAREHSRGQRRSERALTERESEIVLLVAEGYSNKQIARELTLSEGTVKIHLHNIYRKVQVTNRTTLAAVAFSWRGHDEQFRR